jgi:hypothetical protein
MSPATAGTASGVRTLRAAAEHRDWVSPRPIRRTRSSHRVGATGLPLARLSGHRAANGWKVETMGNSNAGTPAGGREPTKNRVKEQSSQVAQGAAHTGQELAHTAVEQGTHVAQEAGQKARGLVDQAQAELKGQAADRQKRAASGLRTIGDQLRSMADQSGQQGTASGVVHQASDRVQQVADWLEQREPGQVVEEVRNFARRSPGTFLTGAVIAGVLAGRLTRNMASRADQGGGDMGSRPSDQTETGAPAGPAPSAAAVPPPAAQPDGART